MAAWIRLDSRFNVNRKIVELDSKLSELTVQFKEAVRDIKVTPSPAG